MSFFARLFGGGAAPADPAVLETETHEGHTIEAAPEQADGQWRLRAVLTKEIGGEVRRHVLVRADVFPSQDEAGRFAMKKAKQVIDEQGDAFYG